MGFVNSYRRLLAPARLSIGRHLIISLRYDTGFVGPVGSGRLTESR